MYWPGAKTIGSPGSAICSARSKLATGDELEPLFESLPFVETCTAEAAFGAAVVVVLGTAVVVVLLGAAVVVVVLGTAVVVVLLGAAVVVVVLGAAVVVVLGAAVVVVVVVLTAAAVGWRCWPAVTGELRTGDCVVRGASVVAVLLGAAVVGVAPPTSGLVVAGLFGSGSVVARDAVVAASPLAIWAAAVGCRSSSSADVVRAAASVVVNASGDVVSGSVELEGTRDGIEVIAGAFEPIADGAFPPAANCALDRVGASSVSVASSSPSSAVRAGSFLFVGSEITSLGSAATEPGRG